MIIGLISLGVFVLFATSHLVVFYLTGKHLLAIEAQRDSYKKIALLAIDDCTKTQNTLNDVMEAILEATEEKPSKKLVGKKVVADRGGN